MDDYVGIGFFLQDITHMVEPVRVAGAEALSSALQLNATEVDPTVRRLIKLYNDKLPMTQAVVDKFGREIEPSIDLWEPRSGIAIALCRIVPLLDPPAVVRLTSFFVPKGH